ncbi:hypothetical protein CK241_19520, partial [Klebsiella pneumoniae]
MLNSKYTSVSIMMSYQGSLTRVTHAQKGGHSGGLDKPNFRFSLPISQLMAKAIPVRGAKFKKPAFEQAFCFFASLTLTQHRIQPGKHLVDNDVRYAFQTLAFP